MKTIKCPHAECALNNVVFISIEAFEKHLETKHQVVFNRDGMIEKRLCEDLIYRNDEKDNWVVKHEDN